MMNDESISLWTLKDGFFSTLSCGSELAKFFMILGIVMIKIMNMTWEQIIPINTDIVGCLPVLVNSIRIIFYVRIGVRSLFMSFGITC